MISHVSGDEAEAPSGDDDLLTRAEASAFLALMGIRLKPATLARIWSTAANGPPCRHIRAKPFYPRGLLRDWARGQISELRTGAPPVARGRGRV
jgi:hypothetical protein